MLIQNQKTMQLGLKSAAIYLLLALGGPLVSHAEPVPVSTEDTADLIPVDEEGQIQLFHRDLMIPLKDAVEYTNSSVEVNKRGWTDEFMLFNLDPGWCNLCVDGTSDTAQLDYCSIGDTRFAFVYDHNTKQLKNSKNGKCLTIQNDWDKVYPADCDEHDYKQRWFYSREIVDDLEENKWKVVKFADWKACMAKNEGFQYAKMRLGHCYENWLPDKNKRFEIIRYSDHFGVPFIIRNRNDGKCVTVNGLNQALTFTGCSGDSRQLFRWNPKTWLLRSEHWATKGKTYCLGGEGVNKEIKLRECDIKNSNHKFFAFDGLVRSAQGDWKDCLGRKMGSNNAFIRDCFLKQFDDVAYSFASKTTDRILKRQLTLKISMFTFTEKFSFW